MYRKPMRALSLLGVGLMLGTAGCVDMDFENLNAPDRDRALSNPEDVESLVAATFDVLYSGLDATSVRTLFPAVGTEMTTATTYYGAIDELIEPRSSYNNAPDLPAVYAPHGPRDLWRDLLEVTSSAYDGLQLLGSGMELVDSAGNDNTPRLHAFAKFMQGWAMGYLAMVYDHPVILHEDVEVRSDAVAQGVELMTPYQDAIEVAIEALEEAKQIAAANTFEFPARQVFWFGTENPVTNQDLIRMANTLQARLLVLNARTPAERAAVNWSKVLEYTANGVTEDFAPVLASGLRSSSFFGTIGSSNFSVSATLQLISVRWDQRLIGHADTSGAYQAWINNPDLATRNAFLIETPDRRITGPASECGASWRSATCAAHGSYTRFTNSTAWPVDRGVHMHSKYHWARHSQKGFANDEGTHPMITVDENNLLRAEALLRTGDREGAAALINITRTRPQTIQDVEYPGLPPVTADGVPESTGCVPRDDQGNCGDIMEALWYERMIELAGIDPIRGWADSRGFGLLPDNAWTQAPVPGQELELFGLPNYTYGGGGDFSAVYAPATADNL